MNLMLTFPTSTRQGEANRPQEKIRSDIRRKRLAIRFHSLFLLLSIALCDVYGKSYAQEISLSYKSEKLDVVLKSISKQSGYRLFYDSNLLKGSRPVTVQVENTTVKSALDLVFAN